jgi:hypothetical protein
MSLNFENFNLKFIWLHIGYALTCNLDKIGRGYDDEGWRQ